MRWFRLRRWWTVAVYVGAALGVMIFAFWPFNRTAREQSVRSQRLAGELEAQIAQIESLPKQRTDLDALQARLRRFKSELLGTEEVDRVMRLKGQKAKIMTPRAAPT